MGRPRSPFARMRLHRRKNQYDEYLIKIPVEIAESFEPGTVFVCGAYHENGNRGFHFLVAEKGVKNGRRG